MYRFWSQIPTIEAMYRFWLPSWVKMPIYTITTKATPTLPHQFFQRMSQDKGE
jgi:hypothetical protein